MIMKRFALLLSMALVLVTIGGWAADQQPGFSRARWLEEQMERGARTPDNLVPADPQKLKEFLDQLAKPRPPGTGIPKGVVRVSSDILAPEGGVAQPETETEPFFAIDPENPKHLLGVYQEDRFLDEGCRNLTSAISLNGGATWRETLLPNLTVADGGSYERTSDPWVAFGTGGRAYFAALAFNETSPQNGVYLSSSDDGGLTWSDPVSVHSGTQTMDDKEAVVVDTRDDSPYKGRVYVGWDFFSEANQQQPEMITYSDDGGRTFQTPFTLTDQGASLGIVPLVGPGGIVHAVWLNYGVSVTGSLLPALLTSHSTDGGRTWSAPVTISEIYALGVSGSRTGTGLPSVAIDGRTGALYVVWEDSRFALTDQVALSRSTDGGQTWSAPIRVSDGPGDAPNFTPAVAVTPEGWVGVSYYSLRNNPAHVLVDEYLAISTNGGQRFAKSQRLTASSWDLRFAATSDGFFLGDYQGLAAFSRTFYPLWVATYAPSRLNPQDRQPDVFTRVLKVR
jgi:hypothetical protein